MQVLIGFISALPELIKLITSFMTWLNQVSGNDPRAYAAKVASAFDELNRAETPEAKSAAAQTISNLIAGLPG